MHNTLFLNRGDQTFSEISQYSNTHASEWSWGTIFMDVDLDGHEDILIATGHMFDVQDSDSNQKQKDALPKVKSFDEYKRMLFDYPTLELNNIALKNKGNMKFENVDNGWGIGNSKDISHGIATADLDNDGDIDLYVTNFGKDILYQNNGDGSFTDVTLELGIDNHSMGMSAAFFDSDNDGFLDLIIGNETTNGPIYNSELYHNNGDGTFTEKSQSIGLNIFGFIKAVVWGDIDNDGDLDIFISRLGQPNSLYRNNGETENWSFTDIGNIAGVLEPIDSFPAWIFDYNNDGWEDIWVSGYDNSTGHVAMDYLGIPNDGETPRLYKNNKDGTFSNVTFETNMNHPLLTMGSNFGDINNDGFLDLFFTNRTFYSAGKQITPSDRNYLLRNKGNDNNWIKIELEGTESNRDAYGARVKMVAGSLTQYREHTSAHGYNSANDLRLHFGLADNAIVDSIEVLWPSGKISEYSDIGINQLLTLKE